VLRRRVLRRRNAWRHRQPCAIPVTSWGLWHARHRRKRERSVNVTVRAKTPELLEEAIEETRTVLRADRGVRPGEEDDFSFFTNDSNIKSFNQVTRGVKIGAFVIGIIALLVAGTAS
jgi:hypothetical protein